jgi:hypothetical protein
MMALVSLFAVLLASAPAPAGQHHDQGLATGRRGHVAAFAHRMGTI